MIVLRRKAYNHLLKWKEIGNKPLLIYGQRQVGKTFIIKKFAEENYEQYVYIDLSKDVEYHGAFENASSVEKIMLRISTLKEIDPSKKKPLIILDEIQECEEALSSLKMFALEGSYDVIASGSMLGVTLSDSNSKTPLSPMGYAEPYVMYSLDFEEFLWSQGISEQAISHVRDCVRNLKPIDEVICNKFHELYRLFMILGGMPASINAFNSDKGTFGKSSLQLDSILAQVKKDINRYNTKPDRIKTAECFDSIPKQLAETNKRFHYSRVSMGAGSRKSADKYMGNLLWIKDAGYGNFIHALNGISSPIVGFSKQDVFKVYMSDTGILTHMYGKAAVAATFNNELLYNLGAIAENVVAESLVKCGYTPFYYHKKGGEGRMEIDFVLETYDGLVAIEVKSGKQRTAPSIGKVEEYFKVAKKVMLEEENIHIDDKNVIHLPMFVSAFMDSLDHEPDFMKGPY